MITLTHEGDHWEFWLDPAEAPKTGMCIGSGAGLVTAAENAMKFLESGKEEINLCLVEFAQQRVKPLET